MRLLLVFAVAITLIVQHIKDILNSTGKSRSSSPKASDIWERGRHRSAEYQTRPH